jgi:hypothetical protein
LFCFFLKPYSLVLLGRRLLAFGLFSSKKLLFRPDRAQEKGMKNPEVARGIGGHSRSKSYHRRGLWAIKKKNGGKFPTHAKKEKAAEAPAKVMITVAYMRTADQCSSSMHMTAHQL